MPDMLAADGDADNPVTIVVEDIGPSGAPG